MYYTAPVGLSAWRVRRWNSYGEPIGNKQGSCQKWYRLSELCLNNTKLSGPMPDNPPPCRATPFRLSIAEGVSHPFALFSCGISQVSLRYPFCGGGGVCRASASHALQGGKARKGGGYRTQLVMLRHRGVSLRHSRGIAQYRATKIPSQNRASV